jgi:hypothetical protein
MNCACGSKTLCKQLTSLKIEVLNIRIWIQNNYANTSAVCSRTPRTFGTLFWNDTKSAHGVLEQCLIYCICVQPCITISLVIRIINRIKINIPGFKVYNLRWPTSITANVFKITLT